MTEGGLFEEIKRLEAFHAEHEACAAPSVEIWDTGQCAMFTIGCRRCGASITETVGSGEYVITNPELYDVVRAPKH